MGGDDEQQGGMFSYVTLEQRMSQKHPMRRIALLPAPASI